MSALLQIFALIVLTFLILAVLAVRHFGLLGLLFVAVLLIFCLSLLQRLAGKILKRFFLSPFIAKGTVLHNAAVRVRSITAAPAPMRSTREKTTDFDTKDEEPRDWYLLDVTITPQESGGEVTHWEPGELVLVALDAKPDDINETGSTLGRVHAVEVWQNGGWQADNGGKYEGPQRLKLLVAVQPDAQRMRFRYYLEIFGELDFATELGGV